MKHIQISGWIFLFGIGLVLLSVTGCGAKSDSTSGGSADISGLSSDEQILTLVRQGNLSGLKSAIDGDPNLANAYDDASGKSALHYAAEGENEDVVKYLLEKGADPLALDNDDRTPLQGAEEARSPSSIQSMLKEAQIKAQKSGAQGTS